MSKEKSEGKLLKEALLSKKKHALLKMEDSEVTRYEPVFSDIVLADMLNDNGDSILDMYEYYDTLTTYQQANLDASDDWADQTTPDTILVALTPEEMDTLSFYNSKSDVEFSVTIPQRNE